MISLLPVLLYYVLRRAVAVGEGEMMDTAAGDIACKTSQQLDRRVQAINQLLISC